jgi:hypothetical protein
MSERGGRDVDGRWGIVDPRGSGALARSGLGPNGAEAGTAFGQGAQAIAGTASSLVTVELDAERAAIVRTAPVDRAKVEVIVGDWREELPPRGPFAQVPLLSLVAVRFSRENEQPRKLPFNHEFPQAKRRSGKFE